LANSHTVDIMKLKERMGHRSILTTQRYLSAAEQVDHTASDALETYLATAGLRTAARRRCRVHAGSRWPGTAASEALSAAD